MATDLTGFTGRIRIIVDATPRKAIDLAIPEAVLRMVKSLTFAFGTGLGKANQIFWDRRVITGDGNDPLDLTGPLGSPLANPFEGVVNFANIKGIALLNRSDETLVHAGGTHTATDAIIKIFDAVEGNTFLGPCEAAPTGFTLKPGGMFLTTNPLAAGWTVTDDSTDIFRVDNEDAVDDALYDIVLIGEST